MGFDRLAGLAILLSPLHWTSRAALQNQPAPGGGLRRWTQLWHHQGLSNHWCLFPVPETQASPLGWGLGPKSPQMTTMSKARVLPTGMHWQAPGELTCENLHGWAHFPEVLTHWVSHRFRNVHFWQVRRAAAGGLPHSENSCPTLPEST